MDKESISRLGLDYISGIDLESSDEIYDPGVVIQILITLFVKFFEIALLIAVETVFPYKFKVFL